MSKHERLIKRYETTDPNSLEDLLYVMAVNIEDSLLGTGAVPGKDYTILDCYKLAQPFALSEFENKDKKVTYMVGWPS